MSGHLWMRAAQPTPNAAWEPWEPFPVIEALPARHERRRLPSYGKELLNLRRLHLAPPMAVLIMDGSCPTAGATKYVPWVAAIPDHAPAETIDFRFLGGLLGYLVTGTIDRLDGIAAQTLRYNPRGMYGWADAEHTFVAYARRHA